MIYLPNEFPTCYIKSYKDNESIFKEKRLVLHFKKKYGYIHFSDIVFFKQKVYVKKIFIEILLDLIGEREL